MQATCQEVVFFRRGNAYGSLTFKDYIKGDILPHPLPHYPITPFREDEGSDFSERVEAGDPGDWGFISLGIASMFDPTQKMSFQPGPLHLHTNINIVGVCLPNLQVVVQFLPSSRTRTFTTPQIPIESRRQRVERQVNQILNDETTQV